jgi:hypothetical protein
VTVFERTPGTHAWQVPACSHNFRMQHVGSHLCDVPLQACSAGQTLLRVASSNALGSPPWATDSHKLCSVPLPALLLAWNRVTPLCV